MGGYGSGRTSGKQKGRGQPRHKRHHLASKRLSKRRLVRWLVMVAWRRRDSAHIAQSRIVLDYNVRLYGGEWEPTTQTVRITHTNCNYGGQRPYFLCPGVISGRHCGRRVGKLFAGGRYFLCRHCYNIAYSSQSEARHDRMLRRANKLRTALGGEPGAANFIAFKPKGIWQRTYDRKQFETQWCENQAAPMFLSKFSHLLTAEEREIQFDGS